MAIIKAWPPDKSEKKWTSDDPLLALNEQKSSLEKNGLHLTDTRPQTNDSFLYIPFSTIFHLKGKWEIWFEIVEMPKASIWPNKKNPLAHHFGSRHFVLFFLKRWRSLPPPLLRNSRSTEDPNYGDFKTSKIMHMCPPMVYIFSLDYLSFSKIIIPTFFWRPDFSFWWIWHQISRKDFLLKICELWPCSQITSNKKAS